MTWEWAEPDHRLWSEAILWAQLHDQSLEPRSPPSPAELLETAGDGGWSASSLGWQVTPSNTLYRVKEALTSLQRGVSGDGHSTPKVADKKAEGTPLARIASAAI